ncbi:hypothetical protein ACJ51O_02160 [Burkholderia pyrrocinia]|uniref:hypothetical protein n=1 Tax=Burkholderia pyrrocinia TaxID=60550 RepID=UPI0038B42353
MHSEQDIDGDKTWIVRVSSLTSGEPVNSATFDIPDVGAAQKFRRDKRRAGSAKVSDGAYDVSNNSCMMHVMDVLNAGEPTFRRGASVHGHSSTDMASARV